VAVGVGHLSRVRNKLLLYLKSWLAEVGMRSKESLDV
jgi:hypothetical protein